MTTIRETPDQLTIKSFTRIRRLVIGLVLLIFGLLVAFAVFIRLIQLRTLVSDALTELPANAQAEQELSSGEVMVRLSYQGVRSVIYGPRPVAGLGFLSFITGIIILLGYKPGQVITFDKTNQQVTIVQADRFFRPQITQYPLQTISGVRMERDRSFMSQGENNYTVRIEIDLNDPADENQDFVYKKPILLSTYKHNQGWAQNMVQKIEAFIEK